MTITITAHGLLHIEYFKQLRMTNTMTKFIQGIITFFLCYIVEISRWTLTITKSKNSITQGQVKPYHKII